MAISADRVNRILPRRSRENEWQAFERYSRLETVGRDLRPTRAVMGYIMTAIGVGSGLTMAIWIAAELAEHYLRLAAILSSF